MASQSRMALNGLISRRSGQLPNAIEPARRSWGDSVGHGDNAAGAGDVVGDRRPGAGGQRVPAFDDVELVRHRRKPEGDIRAGDVDGGETGQGWQDDVIGVSANLR